jgi:transmembrane sensor
LILESQQPPQLVPIDPQRALAWESGELAFADDPLSLAVERVNRYAKQRLHIGDAAAAQVRISGVFHAGDTEAFIYGVTRLFPVRVERTSRLTTLLFDDSADDGR